MERLCQYRDEKEAFHAEQARKKGTLFEYPYHVFNFIATNDPSLYSVLLTYTSLYHNLNNFSLMHYF